LIFLSINPLYGDDTDLFTARVEPNVLILMDNSASMNEVIYHASYDPQTAYTGTYTNGRIYYFMDTTYKTMEYPFNEVSAKLYWGPGDENNGVRYNGNYLNWIFWHATEEERNNLPQKTRIQVAREVLTDIVNNITGIRFGLMNFNSEHGGAKIADCGASKDTLINAISGMLATTWTPMSESMVEAWYYFTGGEIGDADGDGDDDQGSGKKSFYNDVKYNTPIEYYCQKNFIILITDGEPTKDWTFPDWVLTAIEGHYDTTPQVGNENSPYYLDGVAWYLNNRDASSKLDGPQNVSTHIIGFNTNHPLLERTASASKGGGTYSTASNAEQLSDTLKKMLKDIDEGTYLFTSPTVPANRINETTDNVTYIATFSPSDKPFWEGNLKAYQLGVDGTLPVDEDGNPAPSSLIWNAHEKLKTISPDSRKIYTYLGGTDKEEFKVTNSNLTKEVLEVVDADRDKLIKHIRGVDGYDINKNGKTDEKRSPTENIWILGDIFHSNPVIVGEPSRFFEDVGFNGPGGFYEKNKDRAKVILVGANDGMLHAFNADTGIEEWAFIPSSVLKNLKSMISDHAYYVDSSPKVADVWFGDENGNEKKDSSEWRTVLVCGLRKGGKHHFALDITDTSNPKYLWEFPKSADSITLAKLGQSWSEPAIGRVKIKEGNELRERWVAFMGGGFDEKEGRKETTEAIEGKAFFVVDVKTGDILWQFNYDAADDIKKEMKHSLPAPPTAVDTNANGYVDRVYIGDLGGQMWVFDVSADDILEWAGNRLFESRGEASERHPIYYQPAVAFDKSKNPWVFFGTGDREHPTEKNSAERFYAIRDEGPPYDKPSYPLKEGDLENVTSNNTLSPSAKKGWYIKLENSEKVLAKPAVFNKLIYFTTYTYTSKDECKAVGSAALYVVEYLSGGGALVLDDYYLQGKPSIRSESIAEGVPSAPVISVTLKGKASASITIGTTSGEVLTRRGHSPSTTKEILYWREVIP
jgi:type IV pilus assembly protein PilY1